MSLQGDLTTALLAAAGVEDAGASAGGEDATAGDTVSEDALEIPVFVDPAHSGPAISAGRGRGGSE